MTPLPPLPPDLRAAVLERAKATPSPSAAEVRRARVVVGTIGAAVALGVVFALGVSPGGRPMPFVVLGVAGWAVLAAAASIVAGARTRTMLGGTRARLVATALAAGPAVFAWLMACTLGWPGVRDAQGSLHAHLTCFVFTGILSLGPLLGLAYARRGSDPVHPRATGAAIGAAAGAWGAVLIDLHCPLSGPVHVALGHVLPLVIQAGIGALLGSRLFGMRSPREK